MASQPLVKWDVAPPKVEPGDPLPDADFVKPPAGAVYRSGRTRARVAAALVGISTVSYVVDGILSAYGMGLLANLETTTEQDLVTYDEIVRQVALGIIALYVAAGIATLAWLRRVVSNLPALGGGEPAVGPTGAVVWWFVPIANLFKPYQAVADSWRSLATSPAGTATRTVLAWWLLFLLGNTLSNLYARMPLPETIAAFNSRETLNIVADVVIVLTGILFVRVILELERRSVARSRAVAARVVEEERAAAAAAASTATMASWTLGQESGALSPLDPSAAEPGAEPRAVPPPAEAANEPPST